MSYATQPGHVDDEKMLESRPSAVKTSRSIGHEPCLLISLHVRTDDPTVDNLNNTYWVRFDHRDFTHEQAVRNTVALFEAARQTGVERVAHVSIHQPVPGQHVAVVGPSWPLRLPSHCSSRGSSGLSNAMYF
jgi:hypothetical protein